jgi:hypothetical protein
MNPYRLMVMAVTTCAVGLSAGACTAGVTTAHQATPPSPGASRTASSPAPAASQTTPPAPGPADTVSVDAPIHTFPIPPGAQVAANMPCGNQVLLELGSVTPSQASTFDSSALPRAGYRITENTLTTEPNTGTPQGMAEITFTGHAYTGLIIAIANLNAAASANSSMPPLPKNIAKNVVEIGLCPPGTANASASASACL